MRPWARPRLTTPVQKFVGMPALCMTVPVKRFPELNARFDVVDGIVEYCGQ